MADDSETDSRGLSLLVTVLGCVPIIVIADRFGDLLRGEFGALSLIVITSVSPSFWHMKKSFRFWIILGILLALHAFLVFRVHWNLFPHLFLMFAPIFLLDMGFCFCVFKVFDHPSRKWSANKD